MQYLDSLHCSFYFCTCGTIHIWIVFVKVNVPLLWRISNYFYYRRTHVLHSRLQIKCLLAIIGPLCLDHTKIYMWNKMVVTFMWFVADSVMRITYHCCNFLPCMDCLSISKIQTKRLSNNIRYDVEYVYHTHFFIKHH